MDTAATTQSDDDLMSAYLRHWKALCAHLRKRTGSQELAEDALQETWLRLAGMKGDAAAIQDHHAFILRVAGNIAIDLVRRERRHTVHCVSDETLLAAVCVIDRDQLRLLALALARLPAKPRAALLLSRCDGLSHREIGVRLKVSESMVAKYLGQALRHCRDHYRHQD